MNKTHYCHLISLLLATSVAAQQDNSSLLYGPSKPRPEKTVAEVVDGVKHPEKDGYFGHRTRESAIKALTHDKEVLESHGYKWFPPEEGIPDYVEEYDTVPPDDMLGGCVYTVTYTYPSVCGDEKGSIIFDSSKDDQKVLDAIIKAQGKKINKYNQMPNGGPVPPDPSIVVIEGPE